MKRVTEKQSVRLKLVVFEELADPTQEDLSTCLMEFSDPTLQDTLRRTLSERGLDTEAMFDRAATALAGMGRIDDD